MGQSAPSPTLHILVPTQPTTPKDIQIQSAVFPQLTHRHRQTPKMWKGPVPIANYITEQCGLIHIENQQAEKYEHTPGKCFVYLTFPLSSSTSTTMSRAPSDIAIT